MDDNERQIMQEFDAIVDSQLNKLKLKKENLKNHVSLKKIPELLSDRKDAFDYKITRMLSTYGYQGIAIRKKIDIIWNELIEKETYQQPNYQRFIRPLNYVFVVNLAVMMVDETEQYKAYLWMSYVDEVRELIKEIVSNY